MIRARNEDISLLPYVKKISQNMSYSIKRVEGTDKSRSRKQTERKRCDKFTQNYLVGDLALCHVKKYFGYLRYAGSINDFLHCVSLKLYFLWIFYGIS